MTSCYCEMDGRTDLSLGEVQTRGNLPAFLTSDVSHRDELLLEYRVLVASVRLSLLAAGRAGLICVTTFKTLYAHARSGGENTSK